MKKTALLLSAVLISTVLLGFSGCLITDALDYSDAKKYTAGNTTITDTVENLDLDYLSGMVKVKTHAENTVIISEETTDGLKEDMRVHWWLDKTTLKIKYAASGTRQPIFGIWEKKLTLTVPESAIFSDVTMKITSAELETSLFKTQNLNVKTASGKADINCEAKNIDITSTSGRINLNANGEITNITVQSTSGNIDTVFENAGKADFKSTSGKITIWANETTDAVLKTTSGTIVCDFNVAPSKCKISSTSGKTTLKLPENADFGVRFNTSSGNFRSDFALVKNGNHYVCKNGNADIEIKTTSGDVAVQKK